MFGNCSTFDDWITFDDCIIFGNCTFDDCRFDDCRFDDWITFDGCRTMVFPKLELDATDVSRLANMIDKAICDRRLLFNTLDSNYII